MVGINIEEQIGISYLYSEKYNVETVRCSFSPRPKGRFGHLLQRWPQFLIKLESMLPTALIVTPEVYKTSLSKTVLGQYKVNQRFQTFCDIYEFKYELIQHEDSSLYFMVDGLSIQVTYASMRHTDNGTYATPFELCTSYKKSPYKKGRHDMYIFEFNGKFGDFICLPEQLLIESGHICTETQKGNITLKIYPYDHVEVRRAAIDSDRSPKAIIYSEKNKAQIKNHWTCNKNLWFSTTKGYLGDIPIHNFNEYLEYMSTMKLVTFADQDQQLIKK